eukprot:CAMPEP_0194351014 /NCGR_PEP_ID=MMETSP0171-20130528/107949_1 /TAXON_ID=218684 /ORGANISM="Corethron pennatum, Strain L29A3" /LENGTH=222 /DNA_ID=CAMNT_0039118607 /DNA_START=270 /DNA_END=938 /DNA_ORIENTATION=+
MIETPGTLVFLQPVMCRIFGEPPSDRLPRAPVQVWTFRPAHRAGGTVRVVVGRVLLGADPQHVLAHVAPVVRQVEIGVLGHVDGRRPALARREPAGHLQPECDILFPPDQTVGRDGLHGTGVTVFPVRAVEGVGDGRVVPTGRRGPEAPAPPDPAAVEVVAPALRIEVRQRHGLFSCAGAEAPPLDTVRDPSDRAAEIGIVLDPGAVGGTVEPEDNVGTTEA